MIPMRQLTDRIMECGLSLVVALIVVLTISLAKSLLATHFGEYRRPSAVEAACDQLQPGMTTDDVIKVMHSSVQPPKESYEGTRLKFLGDGEGGCVVEVDSASHRVLKAWIDPKVRIIEHY